MGDGAVETWQFFQNLGKGGIFEKCIIFENGLYAHGSNKHYIFGVFLKINLF